MFTDPNLVSHACLVPVTALAERAWLAALAAEHVRPAGDCGVNAHLKVPCLVAGMAAGADSIDDMDVLRHGAVSTLFGGVRAPSTLGSHLRSYTWGNVSQLEKAGREFLAELALRAPLLRGAGTLAFMPSLESPATEHCASTNRSRSDRSPFCEVQIARSLPSSSGGCVAIGEP